jgi:predicted secreted Zn-dependent protease
VAPTPAAASGISAEGHAALALSASAPTLPPGVLIMDDTARYPVVGATAAELGEQLGIGREAEADSAYIGLTGTQVRWQFRPLRGDSGCRLTQIAVFLRVVTTLPQWLPPSGTPDSLTRQWLTFLGATLIHEHGHRNIALHTAVDILRTLTDVRGATCEGLDEIANLNAHAVWDLGQRRQVQYDIATAHGVTQGSRWPPPRALPGREPVPDAAPTSGYGAANAAAGAVPAVPSAPTATSTSRNATTAL